MSNTDAIDTTYYDIRLRLTQDEIDTVVTCLTFGVEQLHADIKRREREAGSTSPSTIKYVAWCRSELRTIAAVGSALLVASARAGQPPTP